MKAIYDELAKQHVKRAESATPDQLYKLAAESLNAGGLNTDIKEPDNIVVLYAVMIGYLGTHEDRAMMDGIRLRVLAEAKATMESQNKVGHALQGVLGQITAPL